MGHDLVGLGEVMLRLAAPPPQRLDQVVSLDVQIGGSEANVMAAVSRMGLRTAFISALPSDHAWGDRTVRELSGARRRLRGHSSTPGRAAWACTSSSTARRRVPFGCCTTGEIRPLSQLMPDEVGLDARSGALGWRTSRASRPRSARTCVPSSAVPRPRPGRPACPVSFDVNYRSRLWSAKEARDFLTEMLPSVRYLFIGSDDAETVFELSGAPERVLEGLARLAPAATIALTLGEAAPPCSRGMHGATALAALHSDDGGSGGRGRRVRGRISLARSSGPVRSGGGGRGYRPSRALKCTIWGDIALVRPRGARGADGVHSLRDPPIRRLRAW